MLVWGPCRAGIPGVLRLSGDFQGGSVVIMLSEDLLKLLVCPVGKAPLVHEGDSLVCTQCGTRYAIHDDIPNMLIEEATLPAGVNSVADLICSKVAAAKNSD
jgi:hypothetical protein